MELDIWKGEWGLASIDLDSLRISAYIKFLGTPVRLIEKNNPFSSYAGTFPVFRHGKHTFASFEEITQYLKSQNFNADLHLTADQGYTAWAYAKYLKHKLYPCLQYIWWVDVTNSGQDVRTWFTKNIPFPFNYYYPGKYEMKANETIEELFGEDYDVKTVHFEVYQTAEKCFSDLSNRLGDNEFFFGNRPSSLDATVFAYLALILKIPQKNATLLNTLKSHDNLVQFANRISQRYFTATHQEFLGKINKKGDLLQKEQMELNQRAKDKVFAGMFAIIAMTCYAISKGILQVNFKDDFQNSADYNEFLEMEEEESS